VTAKRFAPVVTGIVVVMLAWPAASAADHIVTTAQVSAKLKERRSADSWLVQIDWTATCTGAAPGTAWFEGDLYLVDADTGEREYAGGVVSTSGSASFSGTRDWSVSARERSRRVFPELQIHCYENFPLHGGSEAVVTGTSVVIPRAYGGGGGGGPGGPGGGFGGGDPTAPLGGGGCGPVLTGTTGPDVIVGGDAGEVVFGLAGRDRIDGRGGHDCLLGEGGRDAQLGGRGNDRLTGGSGADVLVGGPGRNAYDAGAGRDLVEARNGRRELVRCGSGRDRARVDARDRVRSCETILPPRA
jgi:RTX calcium-binding nonapeptide repeat (4 copies)